MKKTTSRKQNVINYYINNIINRIKQLNNLNNGDRKITKILNDEGYKGYNNKMITKDIVRRLMKYLKSYKDTYHKQYM